jgi:yersiniabactin salicyl-AMP ligase
MEWNGIREDCEGWECSTLGDKLREAVALYSEKTAIIDDEKSVTYSELMSSVLSMASFFYKKGIRKNDNVIVQLPNTILFASVFWGLLEIGAVPILMLPAHRELELNGIFKLAQPRAYISVSKMPTMDYVPMAESIASNFGCQDMLFFDCDLEKEIDTQFQEEIDCEKPTYKDVALMLLSGGTTGIPKLIPRTHGDYLYGCKVVSSRCGWKEDTVFLTIIPVAHNFPLAHPGLIGTLMYGGKVVLTMYASPVEIFDYIETEHVTAVSMVPTLVNTCAEYRKYDDSSDISSLSCLLVGGAVFSPADAARGIETFKCTLIQLFGMAEGLVCATSPDDAEDVILNTQGKPCSPYDQIRIVDEDDNDVPEGTIGELITRGPYTITSYYRLPESQKTSFTPDGWYRTGDRVRLTPEGNLQAFGRIKEMINRAGEKIIPSVLEENLCTHQDIKGCTVVGVPDSLLGSRICACIITERDDLKLDEVKTYLRTRGVAEYRLPDQLLFVDVWPLTAVGKIDKNKLAQMAADDQQSAKM